MVANTDYVLKTISYTLLAEGVVMGGFTVLVLCGVTLPYVGVDFTTHAQYGAAGVGCILGAIAALKA